METGQDLIYFWVAKMVMMGVKLTGQVRWLAVHGRAKNQNLPLTNKIKPAEQFVLQLL